MDKVISGVTLVPEGRPFIQISSTAPDEETFILTFTGTYIAEDGDTPLTNSF